MNDNNLQEQNNLIIPEQAEQAHSETFFQRINSKDVLTITSDFFPSIIIIGFISHTLVTTENFCQDNFGVILRALVFIYSAYTFKAIFNVFLICVNTHNDKFGKISLTTMDLIINICYYVAVIFAYLIYKGRSDDCFMKNTFATILLFCLVLIGIINMSRQALNIFMIILCFPIMVYYFLRNPQSFYSNFGIDPEIVKNMPTIKADNSHISMCAICTEDITEGNEILVLRCPGKHFFHGNCIKSWLVQKVNCPICRQENVI